jgi:hypothetical protein
LGVVRDIIIPEVYANKEVVRVLAQFTFYFDGYWKPLLIQSYRQDKSDMGVVLPVGKFPFLNKVLSPFGQFDWYNKVADALNTLALN